MTQQLDATCGKLSLTPSELVATFPDAKGTVKRLIQEYEVFLATMDTLKQSTREFLSSRVPMYDIDISTELVMIAKYGKTIQEHAENLAGLKRLAYLYEPPKRVSDTGVSDADIIRAKETPITELVAVKMNKALCVWHAEKNASMHIYKDNHAHCFSCAKGGDAIDVYMALHGCDFVTAVKALA